MTEGYVKVIGGRVYYRVYGKNRKGIPLILIHGGPGYHGTLSALSPLSKRRPVIVYHQLGCGKSERPKDKNLWKVERFIDEVEKLRQALKIEQMHILGHSWGATVAAEYTLSNQGKVKSLVLASPFLSAELWEQDAKNLISQMPVRFKNAILKAIKSKDFSSEEFKRATKEYYKRHLITIDPRPAISKLSLKLGNNDIYKYMWGPSEFNCTGTLKGYKIMPKLARIKNPTLFTYGKYDMVSTKTITLFKSKLKKSKSVMFVKSSHVPHLEEKEKYLKTVDAFFKENS